MIGFVTGLAAEARLLAGISACVAVGGGSARGAEGAASRLIGQGVTALISFGLAGGLDPALPPGALAVPVHVLGDGISYPCDPSLLEWLGGPTIGTMIGAEHAIHSLAEKVRLFRATGAAAVDLESVAVGRVAAANALPFAVLRAVADPAVRALPPAALLALDADGQIAVRRVVASIARQPNQIWNLIRLAGDANAARRTLRAQVKLRFPA